MAIHLLITSIAFYPPSPSSFALVVTKHCHRRIAKLSGQMRQLEDALATLQSEHAEDPQSFLHEALAIADETGDEGTSMMDHTDGGASSQSDVINVLPALSIPDHGISRFLVQLMVPRYAYILFSAHTVFGC